MIFTDPVKIWFIIGAAFTLSLQQSKARPNESSSKADAPPDLIQSLDENHADDVDLPIRSLPFYGGAKGKYLLIHPSGRTSITNRNPSTQGVKGEDEDEEDVGMEGDGETEESENGGNSTNGGEDGVSVGLPPDNASVAEAKPVGLAIAGPGGVASSRPVATAVVGPGGLALARPVATAIAGVPGAEGLVGLSPGGGKRKHDKYKNHGPNKTNKTAEPDEFPAVAAGAVKSAALGDQDLAGYFREYHNLVQGPHVPLVPLPVP